MNFARDLIEVYDRLYSENNNTDFDFLPPPVFFASKTPAYYINIDLDGNARGIESSCKEELFPATEKSLARTSGNAPYPFFDNVKNLIKNAYKDNLTEYAKEAEKRIEYANETEKDDFLRAYNFINALSKYISKNNILDYIKNSMGTTELDSILKKEKKTKKKSEDEIIKDAISKCFVMFQVCEDRHGNNIYEPCEGYTVSLKNFWSDYNFRLQKDAENKKVCAVTGEKSKITYAHQKVSGNAKLFSSNDENTFTFRGRTALPENTVNISFEAGHKIAAVLQWLEKRNMTLTYQSGTLYRTYIWAMPEKDTSIFDDSFWDSLLKKPSVSTEDISNKQKKSEREESGREEEEAKFIGNWGKTSIELIKKWLYGRFIKSNKELNVHQLTILMGKGRCAITDYSVQPGQSVLNNIERFCERYSLENYSPKTIADLASPEFAKKDKKDRVAYEIIVSMLKGRDFPLSILKKLIDRASNYSKHKSAEQWNECLRLTVNILKGYLNFNEGEDNMLDINETNRSYLYGRLMGVLDMEEQQYLKNKGKQRATHAAKMLNNLKNKPEQTLHQVMSKVENLKLDKAIQSIASRWKEEIYSHIYPNDCTKGCLDNYMYILGFYHQRESFFKWKELYEKNVENPCDKSIETDNGKDILAS
jgi:CRISPR-associated protein Csd1